MSEERLRDALSVFLLVAHAAVPVVAIVFYGIDGLTKPELVAVLAIVVPMLSVVSAFAITHIVRSRRKGRSRRGPKLSRVFATVTIVLPLLFVGLIVGAIAAKAYNLAIRSLDDLKIALSTIEAVFGGYTGTVVAALFEKEETA